MAGREDLALVGRELLESASECIDPALSLLGHRTRPGGVQVALSYRHQPDRIIPDIRSADFRNLVRPGALARVSLAGQAFQGGSLPIEFGPGLVPRPKKPGFTGDDEPALGGLDIDYHALKAVRRDEHLQRVIRAGF